MSDVRAGKGTLGSLLTDPSVYDDIKVLLGNVSRNRSLKALVRYSIKQDEQQHRVINTQASPPQSAPPAPAEPVDERADASLQ